MLNSLRWKLSTLMGRWLVRRQGVRVGQNVKMLGLPTVTGGERGRIVLGDRVVLISDPVGTALGVRTRCILRTLGPDGQIDVGEDTGMSGATICSASSISIGKRVLLGADVLIFDTDFHPLEVENRRYAKPNWPLISRPVVIEDDVFLGTRAIVTKGAHIGRGSIIAAGSIVTGAIPPFSVAAGAPAKVVRKLPEAEEGN